jgi:hypothetical protein
MIVAAIWNDDDSDCRNGQADFQFDLPSILEFELSSPPASLLVEPTGLMPESPKSNMTDAIDTDLLVLLCFHAELADQQVRSDRKAGAKRRVWDIQPLKRGLCCEHCHFCHSHMQ